MINLILASVILGIAIWFDHKSRSIPNQLTYGGIIFGLLASCFQSLSNVSMLNVSFWDAVIGATICTAAMFCVWLSMGIGAADVKLAGAMGALLGLPSAVSALMIGYLFAGVIALAWAIWRTNLIPALATQIMGYTPPCLTTFVKETNTSLRQQMSQRIPMAGFYALGTAFVFYHGSIL